MKSRNSMIALLAFIFLLGTFGIVSAATFNATADSETDSNNPDQNNGSASSISVGSSCFPAVTQTNLIFLKFDLSSITDEISSVTTSSVLQLEVTSLSTGADGTLELFSVVDDSWTEANLTHNDNRPALTTLLATTPVPGAPGQVTFDSAALVTYLNDESGAVSGGDTTAGDDVASFAIRITGCTGFVSVATFSSREGSSAPQLDLFDPTAVHLGSIESSTTTFGDELIWIVIAVGLGLAGSLFLVQRVKSRPGKTE